MPDAALPAPHEPEAGSILTEMLDQLSEGVATLTEGGVVVAWNPRAAGLTGYSLPEVNTIGLLQLFDPPEAMIHLVQQAHEGMPAVEKRLVLRCADGRRLPVDVRCSPMRHLGGTLGRVVVVMRDVSELEALQDRLLQSERLSILGRLAGAVSHEIRNPLTAIFLQADILEDELCRSERGQGTQVLRSLAIIKEEVARLHELVQQYLSLAHLSRLRCEPIELGAYLEKFCAEMQERVAVRDIVLQVEGSGDLGQVALHMNSFRRVLLNLLNNAVEAMPQGGTFTLHGQRSAEAVCLEASDTGCGIRPEDLPLLFSPLHTTKPEGTGLGLYLAREIVTAHGGDITVTSTPGMGTTFTITLPLLATASPAST
jgi:two-component system sensor histidine kinase AtoS